MSRSLSSFRLAAILLLFRLATAAAMSVEDTDFERLLDRSEQIYRAQVMSITCDWSGAGANRHLATFVRLRVMESYRGGVTGEQTLEFFGGTIGGQTQRLVGMPQFQTGEVEILFVRGNHVDLCPLVGIHFGRLRVTKSAADGREQVFLHDGAPLTDVLLIGKEPEARSRAGATNARGEPTRPLTVKEFGEQIRAGLERRGVTPDKS